MHKTHDEPCRLVRPGAERHAGIHADDDLSLFRVVVFPCRDDRNSSERDRVIVFFPVLRPVVFLYVFAGDADGKTDRAEPLAQKAEDLGGMPLGRDEDRDGDLRAVGVQDRVVHQLTVHSVQRKVAVIFDQKSVVHLAHHGRNLFEIFHTASRGDLCPFAFHGFSFGIISRFCQLLFAFLTLLRKKIAFRPVKTRGA